jgi:effector-associated domain 1 (EAD1)-containing protein
MVLVLDSAPLPWHDPRVQNLRAALTDAYPSGSKAEDIVSKVKRFPLNGVNWNNQDGASEIWRRVLALAAQTELLRSLLSQVLNDQTRFRE